MIWLPNLGAKIVGYFTSQNKSHNGRSATTFHYTILQLHPTTHNMPPQTPNENKARR